MTSEHFWTNLSVRELAGNKDPVKIMEHAARFAVFRFLESGGSGPPFNPLSLASFLGLETLPSNDVRDARTVFHGGKLRIEFNPNQPKTRVNYSVAHEIAHTFFPDCKDEIRHRARHEEIRGDDWQLETLCNIGAAELLIPAKNLPSLEDSAVTIEKLIDLRKEFEVSMEALLLRLVRTTKQPTWVFAASRIDSEKSVYKIDYALSTNPTLPKLQSGTVLPKDSVVAECTAIGFTGRAKETWNPAIGPMRIECLGIPAFPGQPFPRVVGFAKSSQSVDAEIRKPIIVRGDATKPRGKGRKVVAFVVNDATPRWGAGFALAVRRKWPEVQDDFIRWHERSPRSLELGNVHLSGLNNEIIFAEMICQHGYGPSKRPRLRYSALERCLEKLGPVAKEASATIHMPMIGSGQAGGNWSIIYEMIERLLSRNGLNVAIYELPDKKPQKEEQQNLLFTK